MRQNIIRKSFMGATAVLVMVSMTGCASMNNEQLYGAIGGAAGALGGYAVSKATGGKSKNNNVAAVVGALGGAFLGKSYGAKLDVAAAEKARLELANQGLQATVERQGQQMKALRLDLSQSASFKMTPRGLTTKAKNGLAYFAGLAEKYESNLTVVVPSKFADQADAITDATGGKAQVLQDPDAARMTLVLAPGQ